MSVNKYQPHVLVLPEDDANRQLARGFELQIRGDEANRYQVLPPAGGWHRVVGEFQAEHVPQMRRYPERRMVLPIDFDEQADRLPSVREGIPADLQSRVFVLGVWSEPERLATPLEVFGERLGRECREGSNQVWEHDLVRHNAEEVARMMATVRPFLFS